MKISHIHCFSLVASLLVFAACTNQKRQKNLSTSIDSVSYALGMDMAIKVSENFKEANNAAFVQGYKDASDSTRVQIKKENMNGILSTYFMKKQQEAMAMAQDSTASAPAALVNTNKTSDLLSEADSVSYVLGLDMAYRMKPNFKEVIDALFVQGYEEALDSLNVLLDAKEIPTLLTNYFQKRQQREAELQKEAGLAFLEENKKKEGVLTTESGLQYLVLNEGNENKPKATDQVTVHYHGTTPEGVVFDSSVDRGEPASFGLNQVIKGWTEGLQLMGEGAKYKFFIPQELAYGANPRGGVIKPYMPLVFEVELIKINE
jgi:FKBP-type peptidyl-prolyl cis-trans isomerase